MLWHLQTHLQLEGMTIFLAVFSWIEMGDFLIKREDTTTFLFGWDFFQNVFIREMLYQSDTGMSTLHSLLSSPSFEEGQTVAGLKGKLYSLKRI